jgi:hypothetical protein
MYIWYKINLKYSIFIFKLYIYLIKFTMYWNIMDMLKNLKSKVIVYVQNLLFEFLVGPHMYIMLQSLIIHIHMFIWLSIGKKVKF